MDPPLLLISAMSQQCRGFVRLVGGLASLCLLLASCSQNPEVSKELYLQRGDEYLARKEYRGAILEYRKALRIDPRFGMARYKLAEAYAANDELRRALGEYVRAADILPENLDVQIKAGNLLLLARRFEDAKARARTVLKKDPQSIPGLILLGNALAGLRNLDDAVLVTEKAIQLQPTRSGSYSNLGVLELSRGNRADAEAAFKKAIAVDGRSVPARLALATFYRTVGRPADAETTLLAAFSLDNRDLRTIRDLASFYVASDRSPEAERYFKAAVDITGDSISRAALAEFYLGTGRAEEAARILQQLAGEEKNYAAATMRLALVDYVAGRFDQAHRALNEVLSRDPKNTVALTLKARVLLATNQLDEAKAQAQAALALNPRLAQAHVVLGKAHLAQHQLKEARGAFTEALSFNPHFVEAHLELSRLHLAADEIDSSIRSAEQAVKSAPGNVSVRLALVRSLMSRAEDLPRAEAEMRTLLAKSPFAPEVHRVMGALYLEKNDRPSARRAFERALELDPKYLTATTELIAMDLAAGRSGDALKRVEAKLSGAPDDPSILLVAAKTHAALGDAEKTERTLRKVIQVSPSTLEGYMLLGQLFVAVGRLDEAQREFAELARRQPDSVAAHTMVGLLLHTKRDLAGARTAYERAVALDRRAAAAANNLAWIHAEHGENLDIALDLARAARAQLPREPKIADTLAWIYFKKNMAEMALPLLADCIKTDPNNPVYHYHLGMAHARMGEDAKARRSLELALRLQANFDGAAEARKTLASLIY